LFLPVLLELFMKIAVFFIGRKRPGFDPEWGAFLVREIQSQLVQSPFETIFFHGIADEKAMREAIVASQQAGVKAVILCQPTMGDGNLWPILISDWNGAVIVWATPENLQNTRVSACGLVGAHNWVSGMSQAGRPPYFVYGLPNIRATVMELNRAVFASTAMVKLQHARIGLIGDHAPGFLNMVVDTAAMQQLLGARLKRFGLHEFIGVMESFSDAEVLADRLKAESLGLPVREGVTLTDDAWNISSRYYLAVRKLVDEESLDAVALRCGPELPNEFGVWPYLAVARLASDGINICEEGDVDGAVGCLIAQSLGCETVFNSDWLEHDDDHVQLWHAGATPWGICEPIGTPNGPTLSAHFNSGKPLVVDALLLNGVPITMFRIWRMGNRYLMAICEGRVVEPTRTIEGCSGRVHVNGGGVRKFFADACTSGMPHHLAVMKGHYADPLEQFAGNYQPQPIDVVLRIG
jgi:L-fucose isomerase-like protein